MIVCTILIKSSFIKMQINRWHQVLVRFAPENRKLVGARCGALQVNTLTTSRFDDFKTNFKWGLM